MVKITADKIECPECGETWGVDEVDHNESTGDILFGCTNCETEWVEWGSPSAFDSEERTEWMKRIFPALFVNLEEGK